MSDSIYTIPEVARYLKLSRSKVYALVQCGQLPHVRIGKNVRVLERDLQAWLTQNSVGQTRPTHL
jgi:excisionase family DNA binding protein